MATDENSANALNEKLCNWTFFPFLDIGRTLTKFVLWNRVEKAKNCRPEIVYGKRCNSFMDKLIK